MTLYTTMAAVRATRTAIFGTLQLAALEDGVLPIPSNLSVAIEIGASDRDTLDAELLRTHREYFVLALEPLVDKYARGLSRSRACPPAPPSASSAAARRGPFVRRSCVAGSSW